MIRQQRLPPPRIPTFDDSGSLPGWKEFFVHPKHAFGTLLQFAEFNPLDWINPGYVPPCYREFAPPEENAADHGPVEVKSTESAQGRTVEIRRGTQTVSLPERMIPELVRALQELGRSHTG